MIVMLAPVGTTAVMPETGVKVVAEITTVSAGITPAVLGVSVSVTVQVVAPAGQLNAAGAVVPPVVVIVPATGAVGAVGKVIVSVQATAWPTVTVPAG
jgi:hypothetical protein